MKLWRSIDRACGIAVMRPDDRELREAMKAVAVQRRRFGYRRIHVMLQRQGIEMNIKKLRRLYGEEKLQVRKRGGRKRALGTTAADARAGPAQPALEPRLCQRCFHRWPALPGADRGG